MVSLRPARAPISDLTPKRVFVAGDWHGDIDHARAAIRAARAADCDVILHVGDLMVHWLPFTAQDFDLPLTEALMEADLHLVFVDGNHDAHPTLRSLPPGPDGFVPVLGHIWWAPRGLRWNWSGVRFGALGGARSILTERFTEGHDLFTGLETPTAAEAALLGDEPLDVLVTHDVPAGIDVVGRVELPAEVAQDCFATRRLLRATVERVRPKRVFSGHWHQRVTSELTLGDGSVTRVEVLDQNGSFDNAVVLTLDLGTGQNLSIRPVMRTEWQSDYGLASAAVSGF